MYKILLILLACLAFNAFAEEPTVMDTILLEEITLYSDVRKFQPGAKIEKLTPFQMEVAQEGDLGKLISRFSPINFVVSGALSTIHFRGTSPDHTTVNFGGLNINSLTLGHSNMSTIPSFLFDRVELQYGGSSAINGSGAVGGVIYLGQSNSWTKGTKLKLIYSAGSFGEHMAGTKYYWGNGKFEFITKAIHFQKENNFPFENINPTDIKRIPFIDVQHGAALKNSGLIQELNYQFSPNEFIKSSVWFNTSWQQTQPLKQNNINFKGTSEIKYRNIRIWNQYVNENHPTKFWLGAGYVHDNQVFERNESEQIITNRLVIESSVKHQLFEISELKLGAKYKYIVPDVYSYPKEVVKFEEQFDAFASYFIQANKKLKTTLNLRQSFVTNFKAPFTPSLLVNYNTFSTDYSLLSVNGSVSRSYRVPTLNDRYWGDGLNYGNPDLKPEDGLNFEAGAKYDLRKGENHSTFKLNLFYMDIKQWIEWRDKGGWMAHNVQSVISKGIEFHANTHFEWRETISELTLNYSINPTIAREGKQPEGPLHYTPKHTGNISYMLQLKNYVFYADGNFTGSRTAFDNKTLPVHFISNCGLNYNFKWKQQAFKAALAANNIFNVDYEIRKLYAMPGRNFKLSLTANINFKNK